MLKQLFWIALLGSAACSSLQAHFLWMVDSEKPSYLYGTVHSADAAVRNLPDPVVEALTRSATFHPELELSPENLGRMTAAIFAQGSADLEEELPAELWERLLANARQAGIPVVLVRRVPLQLTPLLFATPPHADFNRIIDVQVYQLARRHELAVVPLETVEEQIGVFRSLDREGALTLLGETLTEHEAGFPTQRKILGAYAAGDLDRLVALMEEEFSRLQLPGLAEDLLSHRNRRMAERLLPHLETGEAFVAVGVGHFPGPDGLIALLEERGYTLTPVELRATAPNR